MSIGNSIPHVDALSRLRFYKESKDEKPFKKTIFFLHWVETDVLSSDRLAAESILERVIFFFIIP